ncbi:2-isopropylmalate synthase [Fredinandcohnia quinoae]|uniref:2-isopropylmalate synthase n=1 Tax=Fredinandcohnia quinoae TaxID=2918902 RepID=A0AAW5E3W0_9BACI|nr:2-isopropylmalate synthase [Fredinandcohnia sp. SECRCQ15]MCH1627615.1 2-isopropylmalate synthase [Fredinandcohnia sp. SECRCQ15]
MRKINIFDTTLRDGEQSAGVNLNLHEKLEIAKQLERLNVDIIEAGFPASSEGDFQSVKEITKIIKNCSVTGLARSVKSDIDSAWEALKGGAEPRLHLFLATSPIHMTYKLKQTPDQVISTAVETVKYAAKYFPVIQWSAEDACRSDLSFLVKIIKEVIDAGAKVINIPDTVGYISPKEYGERFKYLFQNVPNIDKVILSAHCHDDLGMAVSNSLSAVENGVLQIEGTINGIGERAGNASLEEVAVALHIRQDYYHAKTRLNLSEIKRTSDLVSKLTGMIIPPNKAIIGKNAFAHESGIHQDGVLKEKTTYEIISPELVGVNSNSMVLGKHSGRHAFRNRIVELGYSLDDQEINRLFKLFKELADKKKEITDEDLITLLVDEKLTDQEDYYHLEALQVQFGTNQIPTATITLTNLDGEKIQEAATGSGSVEALYNTLERCVGLSISLEDYRIQSVGAGRDALAQVYVKVKHQNLESSGRGSAQDVLEASAKGYLNAVNRLLAFEKNIISLEKVGV